MRRLAAPRLIPWHLLIAGVIALFVTAGVWQFERHGQRTDRNALLTERLAEPAEPFAAAAAAYDPAAAAGAPNDPRYRPVVADGRFAEEHDVLWRSRSFDGQPGYHVLTPLLLLERSDGAPARAVLVDRGWVPYRYDGPEVPEFGPPPGPVRVEGRLMPAQGAPVGPLAALAPRDPPDGPLDTVARPDVDRLQAQIPWPLERFVIEAERIVRVTEEDDEEAVLARVAGEGLDPEAGEVRLPLVPPAPTPEGGPHLGYAFQWFSFALITGVGYVLLLRRRLFVPSRRG